jgi:hypothetical protein
MTRGLDGVLTLPSRGLASGASYAPIFYRFISAHWVSKEHPNVISKLSDTNVVNFAYSVFYPNHKFK